MTASRFFISAVLACAASTVHAQSSAATADKVSWLCWIASTTEVEARCIQERADPQQASPDSEDAEELVTLFRIRFHEGASARDLQRLFELGIGEAVAVPIYGQPYEASWKEGRPLQLMRTLLCQSGPACSVALRRF